MPPLPQIFQHTAMDRERLRWNPVRRCALLLSEDRNNRRPADLLVYLVIADGKLQLTAAHGFPQPVRDLLPMVLRAFIILRTPGSVSHGQPRHRLACRQFHRQRLCLDVTGVNRTALQLRLVQPFHPFHEIDVFGTLAAIDGGNVAIPPFDAEIVRHLVQTEVARVLAAGATPFLVGGDHSIVLPALRAIASRHGPVTVMHVDAHLDTSDGEVWGNDFHHGTPLRHALEEGLIERGQLHQIGVRASLGSAAEATLGREFGAHVHSMDEIAARGVEAIAAEVRRAAGLRNVYLTFDVDAIDPAFAPGTGTPVPGGLSSREAIALLRGLAGINLIGMDLVEVAPSLDHADVTCHLAAHLLYEGLALAALRMA